MFFVIWVLKWMNPTPLFIKLQIRMKTRSGLTLFSTASIDGKVTMLKMEMTRTRTMMMMLMMLMMIIG